MSKTVRFTALLGLAVCAGMAHAADGAALAQANNCMTCHTVDKQVGGPSFKQIAAKYKGKSVETELVEKVKKGGSGVWGAVPMPGQPQLSDADARVIVKWVLAR